MSEAAAVPNLARFVSTLVRFTEASGAVAVTVAVGQGFGLSPVVVRYDATASRVELAEGQETRAIPDIGVIEAAEPVGEVHVHRLPPFAIDTESGEVTGVIGGLEHLGSALRQLAALFGPEAGASGTFEAEAGGLLEIAVTAAGAASVSSAGVEFELPLD